MKKGRGKAQASMEFLVIFGFVILMMMPLIMIFFDQTGTVEDSISENQIRDIAIKVADKAESIYYSGGSSKTTLKVYLPDRVNYFNVSSRTIMIGYTTRDGVQQSIQVVSLVNINGSISTKPGIHYIGIESVPTNISGGLVSISES